MQALASQLPFLANTNAELAVPPLFWPDKCIKIGGHVALLSGSTVYTLYCDQVLKTVNFPTPGAKLLGKPPVWQGLKTSKSTHSHIHLKPYEVLKILRQYNMKIVTVNITNI